MSRTRYPDQSAALARRDTRFASLLERFGPVDLGPRPRVPDRYEALARMVVYQQLHGAAAASIWTRVRALVPGPFDPAAVLAAGPDRLRSAGLSAAKARAVTDLARHVDAGTVQLHTLGRRDDDQVVAELTQVWGIGAWTAHMFLIFSLHRMDVWPTGDFGVRAGWERLTATAATLDAAEHLRPYRSLAAWYCWRLVDGPR